MRLTDKRLLALQELLPECGVIADIGTDHGRLGCSLLQADKCQKVWFSDISKASLEKAIRLVERLGFKDRSEFFVGDGALSLPGSPEAAVIAGMGGSTICHILECGLEILKKSVLVLGANTELFALRTFLMEYGFRIDEEQAVKAAGRFYILIRTVNGKEIYSYRELLAGPKLIRKKDEETRSYFYFRRRVALSAWKKAESAASPNAIALRKELDVWETLI